MNNKTEQYDIDFVVTWVDSSDPLWREKKAKYTGIQESEGNTEARYRDWDILKYWFRGVEKFAPWVRNVYFVTDNQRPKWLNTDHPKLKLVDHTDFIPKEYLPLFNSSAIEWNIHRIEGLSEHFVYFNDDMILINHTTKEDFFKDGIPCDSENWRIAFPRCDFDQMRFNNIELINRYFSPKEVLKKDFKKWVKYKSPKELFLLALLGTQSDFSGISASHICIPYLKSTYETLWEKEGELIHKTCCNKLRTRLDLTGWTVRYWQLCSGNFYPKKPIGKLYHTCTLAENNDAIEYITKQKGKVICINDSEHEDDFLNHQKMVSDALNQILPEKSSFEK